MSVQEYCWLADYQYVKAKSEDGSFVSNEERERIRDMHKAKRTSQW